MCRIAGIAGKGMEMDLKESVVKKMCTILKHGGPDDEGIFSSDENNVVLGNRRLALLDLSPGGHQPMSYDNGRYKITYNGEIYNYPALKEELIKLGYHFISSSDTEMIPAAFAAWGTKAFDRFNGMFAFALLDEYSKILYLVRDGAGIKPLYYAERNNTLVFASEVRAFDPIDELQQENPDWKVFLMAYGHLPEPITTLKHVKMLPKGSFLQYNIESGKSVVEAFTHYSYLEKISDRGQAVEMTRDLLWKAVDRHLLSDAPIGVFLSGGLDSSIVALLAKQSNRSELNTLSIFFKEDVYSEKKYQDLVEQSLNCNHREYLLKEGLFHQYFPTILNDMDLPSCDGVNTWFISRFARESGLKAVLSGVGGDELFGGYPSFERMRKVNLLQKLPPNVLRSGRKFSSKKFRRLPYLTLKGAKGKYLFLRGMFIPGEIAAYLNMDEKEVWKILEGEPIFSDIEFLTPGNQASWIELNLYMQNQLLRDADIMSMIHGVEIRVPFLDKDLLNFVMQVSSDVKYSGALPKQLLIDSFKDIIPEPVWNRPKMGFAFPFKEWIATDEYVKETMNSTESNINHYQKFISGNMHWSQLMMLMLIEQRA